MEIFFYERIRAVKQSKRNQSKCLLILDSPHLDIWISRAGSTAQIGGLLLTLLKIFLILVHLFVNAEVPYLC